MCNMLYMQSAAWDAGVGWPALGHLRRVCGSLGGLSGGRSGHTVPSESFFPKGCQSSEVSQRGLSGPSSPGLVAFAPQARGLASATCQLGDVSAPLPAGDLLMAVDYYYYY